MCKFILVGWSIYDMLLLSKRAAPYDIINEYGHFQKEGMAYLALMKKSFCSSLIPAKYKQSTSTIRFLQKHGMNLKFGFLTYFRFFITRIPKKAFLHYFVRPFRAIWDKKTRDHQFSRIGSREAWKRHFRSYGRTFYRR